MKRLEEAVNLISLKVAGVNKTGRLQEGRGMVSPKPSLVSHTNKVLHNNVSMDKPLSGVAIEGRPLPAGWH